MQLIALILQQLLSTVITFIEHRADAKGGFNQDRDLGKLLRALHTDLAVRVSKHANTSIAERGHDQQHAGAHHELPSTSACSTSHINDAAIVRAAVFPVIEPDIDYTDPTTFETMFSVEHAAHWSDFLELLDLSSPLASFSKNPI